MTFGIKDIRKTILVIMTLLVVFLQCVTPSYAQTLNYNSVAETQIQSATDVQDIQNNQSESSNSDEQYTNTQNAQNTQNTQNTQNAQSAHKQTVYVLNAPYLCWEDIDQLATPRLHSILSSSALGNVITRSSLRNTQNSISADEAATCIGSGYWREAPATINVSKLEAGTYVSSESNPKIKKISSSTTSEIKKSDYGKLDSGIQNSNAKTDDVWTSTATSMSENVTFNSGVHSDCRIGQILCSKGWKTAAIGCSDYEYNIVRPAAILASDISGVVQYSVTDPQTLLNPVGDFPYETSNLEAYEQQLDKVLNAMKADDATASSLVAIDSGDLYRAGTYRLKFPGSTGSAYWKKATLSFDSVVGMVLDRMEENDTLIIYSSLSEVSQESHEDDGYGPLIVYGSGYSGILSSKSTGRSGLVTALDISATLANFCGEASQIENGTPLYGEPPLFNNENGYRPTTSDVVNYLENEADLADCICDGQWLMIFLLCILLALAFGCSAIMLSPKIKLPLRVADIMIILTRLFWLAASAFPVSTYLMIALAKDPTSPFDMVALCIAVTISLACVAIAIGKLSGRWLYSLLFLLAITVIVIALDQLSGSHLSRVGYLSYQPIKLGRFTGIGNEGAAVMFGAWMMLSGLLLNRFPDLKISKLFAKVLFPLLSLVLLAIIIAPWWGSNFGALVWVTIGTFAAWWMFRGHRISWKIVICTMVGCILMVIVLIFVDGLGGQSHLGVTASRLISDGVAYIPIILGNMFKLSLDTLFFSPALSIALVIMWVYLAWLRIKKPAPYDVFWDRNYFFKAAFTASMIVSVVVVLVEDSGLLLPALILVYCTAGLTWLICDLHRWQFKQLEKEQNKISDDGNIEEPVGSFKIDPNATS